MSITKEQKKIKTICNRDVKNCFVVGLLHMYMKTYSKFYNDLIEHIKIQYDLEKQCESIM